MDSVALQSREELAGSNENEVKEALRCEREHLRMPHLTYIRTLDGWRSRLDRCGGKCPSLLREREPLDNLQRVDFKKANSGMRSFKLAE